MDLFPLPKSQEYERPVPVLKSVNATVKGTQPCVFDRLKLATGFACKPVKVPNTHNINMLRKESKLT